VTLVTKEMYQCDLT